MTSKCPIAQNKLTRAVVASAMLATASASAWGAVWDTATPPSPFPSGDAYYLNTAPYSNPGEDFTANTTSDFAAGSIDGGAAMAPANTIPVNSVYIYGTTGSPSISFDPSNTPKPDRNALIVNAPAVTAGTITLENKAEKAVEGISVKVAGSAAVDLKNSAATTLENNIQVISADLGEVAGTLTTELEKGGKAVVKASKVTGAVTNTVDQTGDIATTVTGNVTGDVITDTKHASSISKIEIDGDVTGNVKTGDSDTLGTAEVSVSGKVTVDVVTNSENIAKVTVVGPVLGELKTGAGADKGVFTIEVGSVAEAGKNVTTNIAPLSGTSTVKVHGDIGNDLSDTLNGAGNLTTTVGGKIGNDLTVKSTGTGTAKVIVGENVINDVLIGVSSTPNTGITDVSIGNDAATPPNSIGGKLEVYTADPSGKSKVAVTGNITGDVTADITEGTTTITQPTTTTVAGNVDIQAVTATPTSVTAKAVVTLGDLITTGTKLEVTTDKGADANVTVGNVAGVSPGDAVTVTTGSSAASSATVTTGDIDNGDVKITTDNEDDTVSFTSTKLDAPNKVILAGPGSITLDVPADTVCELSGNKRKYNFTKHTSKAYQLFSVCGGPEGSITHKLPSGGTAEPAVTITVTSGTTPDGKDITLTAANVTSSSVASETKEFFLITNTSDDNKDGKLIINAGKLQVNEAEASSGSVIDYTGKTGAGAAGAKAVTEIHVKEINTTEQGIGTNPIIKVTTTPADADQATITTIKVDSITAPMPAATGEGIVSATLGDATSKGNNTLNVSLPSVTLTPATPTPAQPKAPAIAITSDSSNDKALNQINISNTVLDWGAAIDSSFNEKPTVTISGNSVTELNIASTVTLSNTLGTKSDATTSNLIPTIEFASTGADSAFLVTNEGTINGLIKVDTTTTAPTKLTFTNKGTWSLQDANQKTVTLQSDFGVAASYPATIINSGNIKLPHDNNGEILLSDSANSWFYNTGIIDISKTNTVLSIVPKRDGSSKGYFITGGTLKVNAILSGEYATSGVLEVNSVTMTPPAGSKAKPAPTVVDLSGTEPGNIDPSINGGKGILVVRVLGDSPEGAFVLNNGTNQTIIGDFIYSLVKDDTDGNWYLRSEGIAAVPVFGWAGLTFTAAGIALLASRRRKVAKAA